jgi:hypothetical protein
MLRRKIELCGDAPQAAMQSCKWRGVGAYGRPPAPGPVPAGARPKRKNPREFGTEASQAAATSKPTASSRRCSRLGQLQML